MNFITWKKKILKLKGLKGPGSKSLGVGQDTGRCLLARGQQRWEFSVKFVFKVLNKTFSINAFISGFKFVKLYNQCFADQFKCLAVWCFGARLGDGLLIQVW